MITYTADAATVQKFDGIIAATNNIENTRNGFCIKTADNTVTFSPMYDNKLDKWVTRIVQETITTVNNMLVPSTPSYTYIQNIKLLEQCRDRYAHIIKSQKIK